jgi:hypothetical protein
MLEMREFKVLKSPAQFFMDVEAFPGEANSSILCDDGGLEREAMPWEPPARRHQISVSQPPAQEVADLPIVDQFPRRVPPHPHVQIGKKHVKEDRY